jgi:hypothetical protein
MSFQVYWQPDASLIAERDERDRSHSAPVGVLQRLFSKTKIPFPDETNLRLVDRSY